MRRDIPGAGRRLVGRLREPPPRGLEHAEHGRCHPRMPRAHVTQAHPHLRCVHHRSSSPPLARPGETLPLTSPGRRRSIYSNLNSSGCPVVFDVCSKIPRGSDILGPWSSGALGRGAARTHGWRLRRGCLVHVLGRTTWVWHPHRMIWYGRCRSGWCPFSWPDVLRPGRGGDMRRCGGLRRTYILIACHPYRCSTPASWPDGDATLLALVRGSEPGPFGIIAG